MKKLLLGLATTSLFFSLLAQPVLARDNDRDRDNPPRPFWVNIWQDITGHRGSTVSGNVSTFSGQFRACQAREAALKKRMDRLLHLAKTIENAFSRIAGRVEDYYTKVLVPKGITIANYDSLVADINTKKGLVDTALTKARAGVNLFNCLTGNPKSQMNQFRRDMQAVKRALKDYRTSVRNLIVAVRTARAGGPAPTVTPNVTPTPTITPTATPTPTPTLTPTPTP